MLTHRMAALLLYATLGILCMSRTASMVRAQSPSVTAPALAPSCVESGSKETATLLRDAKRYLHVGRYEDAQRLAFAVLAQSPGSSDAMYLLGHVFERRKMAGLSLEWFTKAASIAKPTAEDLRTVALDYVLLNDYTDAIRWLKRATAFDPRNSEAWYDLGRAYMTEGDTAAAEAALQQSLQLNPRSVKAENNLGVNYEAENLPDDALQAYRLAIAWQAASTHRSEQPLLNLGALLITQQHGPDAISFLQEAVTIAPESSKVHEQLALAFEQAKESQKALAEMKQAVSLDPSNPRTHYEFGQMLRRAGNAAEASEELRLSGRIYGAHSTSTDH